MASLRWLLASLATVAVAVALQAPPSSTGGEPGRELSEKHREGAVACGAPSEDGVGEEMELLGLAWPLSCVQRAPPSKRTTPVMWIHLHKAAGTTICALARLNGERTVHPGANCNWYPYDDMAGKGISCKERVQFFKEQGQTWGAIERVVTEADFCPGFDYGLLLRDPAALALSLVKSNHYTVDDVHKSMLCVKSGADDCSEKVTGVRGTAYKGLPYPTIYLWYFLDNFAVRTLAGQDARDAPPGKLQQRHFDRAMEVVKRMKVTLLLEDVGTAALSRAFGWANVPTLHQNPSQIDEHQHFTHGDMEEIKRLNDLDYRLYNYIKSIPMEDRVKPIS